MESREQLLGKIRGCMYGGAVGDALGYAVEFKTVDQIFRIYGENGIQDYELCQGKALISDDTQMTLFTANGLLLGYTRGRLRGIMGSWEGYVRKAYEDWFVTQHKRYNPGLQYSITWLRNVKDMFKRRAPGGTCLSALASDRNGSVDKPINDSKGCGGVMRVAPVGLYLPNHINNIQEIDKIGAEVAAITHGHPLGYIPAAALVHIIVRCVTTDWGLEKIIDDAITTTVELCRDKKHIDEFETIMKKALALAHEDMDDMDAINKLGEGWVAEETLAIAVYCAIKYQNDFAKAITVSVNHDGDSDSTGAVTGNILGAYLGFESIPAKYIEPLELKEVIEELAVDMFEDCKMSEYGKYRDEKWIKKYCEGSFGKEL